MKERSGDRWVPVVSSVLVHGLIIAALGWSWWNWRKPQPVPQSLAIEAEVVPDNSAAQAAAVQAEERRQEQEDQQREEQAKEQAQAQERERLEAEKRAAEQKAAEEAEARQQTERRAAEEKAAAAKVAEQKVAAEREERERQARADQEAAALKAKQDAERRRQELAKRQAEEERQRSEQELRSQLAAEERLNAARSGGQQAQYVSLIQARVMRSWIKPPSARAGIDCQVRVTQVPGGVVTGVQIGSCNGDAAVRESIEAAVYRASPLPSPDNPELFDRNLTFNFRPNE